MILPSLCLPSRANKHWPYFGIDSPEHCQDLEYFHQYPHAVQYDYNSRGYRDHEWPSDPQELKDSIWCLGDSATVGLGQPFTHIWPQVLQTVTGRRCINVSMDGASNDWIYRMAKTIVEAIQPRDMVVMWTYTHRRELPREDIDDEHRRIWASKETTAQDTGHWILLANALHDLDCNTVQCTIPEFDSKISNDPWHIMQHDWNRFRGHDWPACPRDLDEFENLPDFIKQELKTLHQCYWTMKAQLEPVQRPISLQEFNILATPDVIHIRKNLDRARDGHHFDVLTAQWVVNKILSHL